MKTLTTLGTLVLSLTGSLSLAQQPVDTGISLSQLGQDLQEPLQLDFDSAGNLYMGNGAVSPNGSPVPPRTTTVTPGNKGSFASRRSTMAREHSTLGRASGSRRTSSERRSPRDRITSPHGAGFAPRLERQAAAFLFSTFR